MICIQHKRRIARTCATHTHSHARKGCLVPDSSFDQLPRPHPCRVLRGVVRVEGANSTHFGLAGARYPGELFGHSPGALALLRAAGHSGWQWSPAAVWMETGSCSVQYSASVFSRPVSLHPPPPLSPPSGPNSPSICVFPAS